VYPTLLAFCNEMSAMLARLLGHVCAIVALGVIAAQMCGLPRVEAAVEPMAARDWINIVHPHRAFAAERVDWLAATGAPELRGRQGT
jgi:hypothetical protein